MTYTIPQPTKLVLKTKKSGCIRSSFSPSGFASPEFQAMLALFAGFELECDVYSGTNVSFYVEGQDIRNAWDELDKEFYWWVRSETVEKCVEKFGKGEKGKLAMSLPNFMIEETPAEIEERLATLARLGK